MLLGNKVFFIVIVIVIVIEIVSALPILLVTKCQINQQNELTPADISFNKRITYDSKYASAFNGYLTN